MAVSHDGQTYLTGDEQGLVRLWDRADRRRPRHELRWQGLDQFPRIEPGRPNRPDRRRVHHWASPTAVTRALLWDTATGKVLGDPLPHVGGAYAVAFSPDGQTFVTGDEDGARLWERPPGGRWGSGWAAASALRLPSSPTGKAS